MRRMCTVQLVALLSVLSANALAQHGPCVESAPVAQADQVPSAIPETNGLQSRDAENERSDSAFTSGAESKALGRPRTRDEGVFPIDREVATPGKLGSTFLQTSAALGGVLLLILALAQLYKRVIRVRGGLSGQIGAGGRAPPGLVEVLGRYPISSGMTLVVLRFDRKVLLLSHAGAGRTKRGGGIGAMQTLCEVGDLEDVASILRKVRDQAGDSISASFERALHEAGSATDAEIDKAMYQPSPGMHVQRPRRVAPGFIGNEEGDRFELTSTENSPAASQVLRRRLGAMRRGR